MANRLQLRPVLLSLVILVFIPSAQAILALFIDLPLETGQRCTSLAALDTREIGLPNRVRDLLPAGPEGLEIRQLVGTEWRTNRFSNSTWSDPDMSLAPGTAVIFVSTQPRTIQLKGMQLTGPLETYVPRGISLVGPRVAQSGPISTTHQLPKIEGLRLSTLQLDGQWVLRASVIDGQWSPSEPDIGPTQGFQLDSPQSFVWSRTYDGFDPVPAKPIEFLSQPQDQVLKPGESLSLSVEVSAKPSYRFQWQKNGINLPGATSQTYQKAAVTVTDSGDYWLAVFDDLHWQFSSLVRVAVQPSPPSLELRRFSQANQLEIEMRGGVGSPFDLERSSDLLNWTPTEEGFTAAGTVTVPVAPETTAEFFRVVYRNGSPK